VKICSTNIKNIIWVRPDSIGDAILAASMIPFISKKFSNARIIAVCQHYVADFYKACPFVSEVIGFDTKKFRADIAYRKELIKKIRILEPDMALHTVYSREQVMNCLANNVGARYRFAFKGTEPHGCWNWRFFYKKSYTHLIESRCQWMLEIDRYKDFLAGLGITNINELKPKIWITKEDEDFADAFFAEHNLTAQTTIALFAGVQYEHRLYNHYGKAIARAFAEQKITVVALGVASDYVINQRNMNDTDFKTINLSGKTTIGQAAAIIKRCFLAVGAETGLAHVACAVGTPNVIILGGGHYGRFMPYSALTSVVITPLPCYGCNWQCKCEPLYGCVRAITVDTLRYVINQTVQGVASKPRIFVQPSLDMRYGNGELLENLNNRLIKADSAEFIYIPALDL